MNPPQDSPFPLAGVRVRTTPASGCPCMGSEDRAVGRIVGEFVGPPEACVVGVWIGGHLVFRRLAEECEVHLGHN